MKLRQIWPEVRASLWFLPCVGVVLSTGLAVGLVAADSYLDPGIYDDWPLLFGVGAAGARGLLATVASSMITVVGVVFSITIVALSLASSQYTSRVLRNFTRDRGNQVVLGVFVSIFAYCLVVLRTIRGGDETAFVPSLAVLFGLLLAFVGIAVLIYFIHHISVAIQAAHILAAVAEETLNTIDRLFPKAAGEDTDADPEPPTNGTSWHALAASNTGYFQGLDVEGVLAFAAEKRTLVRTEREVGDFVVEGSPWASVLGVAAPDESDRERLEPFYALGRQRTIEQDVAFGVRQIVDVALKALSPGINDTTTAAMCIDYLTAILARLTERRVESSHRAEDGEVRLLTCGPTYAGLVNGSFDQIRRNADGNIVVMENLLASVALLATRTSCPSRRRVLYEHAEAVAELAARTIPAARERQDLETRARRVLLHLGGEGSSQETP